MPSASRKLIAGTIIVAFALMTGMLAVMLTGVTVRAAGANWYVDAAVGSDTLDGTSPTVGTFPEGPKKTITAMLGDAAVTGGDIVNVAAGTYNESLDISKSLTVVGAGASTTIINGGDPYSVIIDTHDVEFTGFTVTNPEYTGASDASGIVVWAPWGSPSNVRIHHNVVHDIGTHDSPAVTYGRVGINVAFPYGPVEIDHNEVYNIWHDDTRANDWWANGICVWGSDADHPATDVSIHDNHIYSIDCPNPRAAGISLQPEVTGIEIRDNQIEDAKDYGIELRGNSHDSTVVEGNVIDGTAGAGINYGVRCSDPFPADVTNNTFTGCGTGVWAVDPEAIWGASPAVTPDVYLNRISGNTSYGLDNQLSGATAATRDWWGSVYGPTHSSNPAGTGDAVSNGVTFNPWCTNSNLTEICSFPANLVPSMTSGIFCIPVGESEASTPYLKAADRVVMSVTSGAATHTVTVPTDTAMTRESGGDFDTSEPVLAYAAPGSLTGFASGTVVRAGLQFGVPGATMGFSGPVTVRLYVGPGLDGRRLNIFRSVTGSSGWTAEGITTVAPLVSGGFVTFDANKASYYAAVSSPLAVGSNFYFAEGYTGAGFVEYLCIGNPNAAAATVTVTYLFPDGSTDTGTYEVPAHSRYTVDVNSVVGPDREVSMRVQSTSPDLVAERPMYFDYTKNGVNWTGGHDVVGATAPSTAWYFAEGYTGPWFDEYVCVLNPGTAAAALTFKFQTQEAGEVVKAGYSVPAHSRSTFVVNEILGDNFQTSLKLESSVPVVAERPMYFDYGGRWTGGHCVVGAPALARQYYFAEGTTRNIPQEGEFQEWLTLQNPGSAPITIDAVYHMGEGQGPNVNRSYEVDPGTRATVLVSDEVGENKDVSVHLSSTSDFMAERPMYFDYGGHWTGGHCVIGSPVTATRWFFAEGYTGPNFQEWLTLQNPGSVDATVTITYFVQDGGAEGPRTLSVPAGTRKTVYVNENAGPDLQFSAQVVSDQPIVAERPMYFDYNGVWTGGHDVVGHRF